MRHLVLSPRDSSPGEKPGCPGCGHAPTEKSILLFPRRGAPASCSGWRSLFKKLPFLSPCPPPPTPLLPPSLRAHCTKAVQEILPGPHPGHMADNTLGQLRGGPGVRGFDEHFPVSNYFPHGRAVSRESLLSSGVSCGGTRVASRKVPRGGGTGWHLLKVCLAFLLHHRGHFVGACRFRDLDILNGP